MSHSQPISTHSTPSPGVLASAGIAMTGRSPGASGRATPNTRLSPTLGAAIANAGFHSKYNYGPTISSANGSAQGPGSDLQHLHPGPGGLGAHRSASSSSRLASPSHMHAMMPHLSAGGSDLAIPRPLSRNLSTGSGHGLYSRGDDISSHRQGNDSRTQLFVGNLPFRVRWQDLKDLFRKCGSVLRSDVALTPDNRSKGFGTVLFSNEGDAMRAIEMYNGYTWQSRVLDVRLDQQDPTGSISMATAAAQAAQQAAHQNHQAAMQNMANMMQTSMPLHGQHPSLMSHFTPLSQGGHSTPPNANPWMVAAVANANLAAAQAQAQAAAAGLAAAGYPAQPPLGQGYSPALSAAVSSRSQSPLPQALTAGMGNMSLLRRASSDVSTQGGSGLAPHSAQSHLSSEHTSSPLASASSTSQTATSSTSVPGSGATSPTTVASPGTGVPSSVSPTSARRAPPGSLGPMPPSIFANMSSNAQLPNPPAAAAAAVAAGYSIDGEAKDGLSTNQSVPGEAYGSDSAGSAGGGLASRRASAAVQLDAHAKTQLALQQYAMQHQQQNSPGMRPQQYSGVMVPKPLHGGLVNFYQHSNGSGISGPGNMVAPGYRNTPSPAYANRHLFVGNLPFNCQWQDLKDLFRAAGQILRADVSLGPDGRSRGFGTVLFATPEDAVNAVHMFNGFEFQGRALKVHFDKFATTQGGQPGMLYQPGRGASPSMQYQPMPSMGMNSGHANFAPPPPLQYMPQHFDDNASIPGTPIYEATLQAAMGFPSPGFNSPGPLQMARPSLDQARRDGMPVAAIGSEHQAHMQQHPPPLSPLTIPARNTMQMPSPVGMFSPPLHGGGGPLSPQQGLPLMTPSMPGFSFHPFPQTPPLLPHFLSPGLGPFSPPLAGTMTSFFGHAGPSGLRNAATEAGPADDSTHAPTPGPQDYQTEYFPDVSSNGKPSEPSPHEQPPETSLDAKDVEETREQAGTPTPATAVSTITTPEEEDEVATPDNNIPIRRSSFADATKPGETLGVPVTSVLNRGASMDVPRPNLAELRRDSHTRGTKNESAVADSSSPGALSPQEEPDAKSTKKSAWNLAWLKK